MCSIMGFTSISSISEEDIKQFFDRTKSRGPDMSRMEKAGNGMLCFLSLPMYLHRIKDIFRIPQRKRALRILQEPQHNLRRDPGTWHGS